MPKCVLIFHGFISSVLMCSGQFLLGYVFAQGIIKFLVEENGFNNDRIVKVINTLWFWGEDPKECVHLGKYC